jgi:hypothetical protein
MGFIIAAAVAAAVIAFCFLCYKKAPPTQAIVVTGFGLSRPKVVCGRGVFVLPIVQRADRLNMRLLKIDVKTPETGVKTKEGVSLWLSTASSPSRSTARTPPSRTRRSATPDMTTSASTSIPASSPRSRTSSAWTRRTSMKRSTMCCRATCVKSCPR